MWERWNEDKMLGDPGVNSFNHYAYGTVAQWIYRYSAGVDSVAEDSGFHTINLHPNFDARLGNLDFSCKSLCGTVQSSWKTSDGQVARKVKLPPNTTGRLSLSSAQAHQWRCHVTQCA
jgi:alpha-L-rhamnosidase